MLTKLILLSPNDYDRIKKDCYMGHSSSKSSKSKKELLKDWYEIRQRSLEQSIQNRKHMRDIDSQPAEAKKIKSPIKIKQPNSDVKSDDEFDDFTAPSSSEEENMYTASEDDDQMDIDVTPYTKKALNFDEKIITEEKNKEKKRRDRKRHLKYDLSRDFDKEKFTPGKSSVKRPPPRKIRRKPKEMYVENPERKQSLRPKKENADQRGGGDGRRKTKLKLKFIKHWETIQ